jgi:hypothetical protein
MNNIEILESIHKPEEITKAGMVYEIWEDGEITLQKCGELYGQRGLHQVIEAAIPSRGNEKPKSAAVANQIDAFEARQMILDWWHKFQTGMNGIYLNK